MEKVFRWKYVHECANLCFTWTINWLNFNYTRYFSTYQWQKKVSCSSLLSVFDYSKIKFDGKNFFRRKSSFFHTRSCFITSSHNLTRNCSFCGAWQLSPDSKVHGDNMGPIWGRQDPGGPHVGPMNFATWEAFYDTNICRNLLIETNATCFLRCTVAVNMRYNI